MNKNNFMVITVLFFFGVSIATPCPIGFTYDGDNCVLNRCDIDYDCPSQYNFGKCTEGVCGCLNNTGLVWDSSLDSLEHRDTCRCPDGTRLFWSGEVPKCIPFGQCEEFWQCPQIYNQKQTVSCGLLNDNITRDFNVCLCNYGYENIGFDEDCECASEKKQVWSNTHDGMICLFEQECTQNDHCNSNNCIIGDGQWLGTCEQDYSSANKLQILFI
ncbi:hypothetical protein [Moumouvirus maliensis]|nr:hypothetical protein [Moumouvirus maliensis]